MTLSIKACDNGEYLVDTDSRSCSASQEASGAPVTEPEIIACPNPKVFRDHFRKRGLTKHRRGQGPQGRVRARWDEAGGGGQGRPQGIRGDADVHALPARALAAHTHQQRHRAAQPRDPTQDEVVGTFPDGRSALMLVTARLKHVAESEWGSRRYLDVTLLEG